MPDNSVEKLGKDLLANKPLLIGGGVVLVVVVYVMAHNKSSSAIIAPPATPAGQSALGYDVVHDTQTIQPIIIGISPVAPTPPTHGPGGTVPTPNPPHRPGTPPAHTREPKRGGVLPLQKVQTVFPSPRGSRGLSDNFWTLTTNGHQTIRSLTAQAKWGTDWHKFYNYRNNAAVLRNAGLSENQIDVPLPINWKVSM
jgi:hypothetical protein